jgi:hypothetical protein
MKHFSYNISRKNAIYVSDSSLYLRDNELIDTIAARVVDVTGKPAYVFDYVVNYLIKVYPYQYLEDRCSFTPAEMRSLRALRAFITYVENHGVKAPMAHLWMDLNTGVSLCLVNTSSQLSAALKKRYGQEIVE